MFVHTASDVRNSNAVSTPSQRHLGRTTHHAQHLLVPEIMQARQMAAKQNAGVVGSFLYPVSNDREAVRRAGGTPTNFHANNIKTMRQAAAARKAEPEPEKRELFKMKRFHDVKSKVKESRSAPPSRPSTAPAGGRGDGGFLRAHSKKVMPDAPLATDRPVSARRREKRRPPVPKRDENTRPSTPSGAITHRDYIRRNALEVIAHKSPAAKEADADNVLERSKQVNPEFGRVPQYLVDRKEALRTEREEEERNAQAADVPDGMRVMDDAERVETLALLLTTREQRLKDLQTQHFVLHTPSQIARSKQLQEQLDEIDTAIRVYSRSRILIKDDNYVAPEPEKHTKRRWQSSFTH